ncbi:hypothetical protein [Porphyromonas crevioricanis]|uniref:Uncharacterized protein n=2 Tax=Porphyromonas crevioricanis TaxID=393921 RepID=A0A2X4STE7_9PORP|nr:hypothetical protein [Porphyromonas crevioricanis]GAD05839.1 hypothetical protein PORCRE_1548 [Porphyromonas crevioricanis JCM 15906]GAD07576.1 hypothetical protein PORCAN_1198 [Porphyromonas crevioricanis JCM 13913]SKA02394.1 hypothetical protein SAMN02745203_01628 [Porphyromonas crevioricanis]SQH73111.1 Uncharacterised protein [Porphyromonas crevioricanis]
MANYVEVYVSKMPLNCEVKVQAALPEMCSDISPDGEFLKRKFWFDREKNPQKEDY